MVHNIIFASEFCYLFQYRCSPSVMARITSDEQHIDRSILAYREWLQLRVIGRKKIRRAASLFIQRSKNRRKIADYQIVVGERHVSKWRRMSSDDVPYATR